MDACYSEDLAAPNDALCSEKKEKQFYHKKPKKKFSQQIFSGEKTLHMTNILL